MGVGSILRTRRKEGGSLSSWLFSAHLGRLDRELGRTWSKLDVPAPNDSTDLRFVSETRISVSFSFVSDFDMIERVSDEPQTARVRSSSRDRPRLDTSLKPLSQHSTRESLKYTVDGRLGVLELVALVVLVDLDVELEHVRGCCSLVMNTSRFTNASSLHTPRCVLRRC